MSNPSMKGAPSSQNCKKKQQVISWETVKDSDYQHFALHSKLISTLSLTVNAKVDEIKQYALLKLQGLSAEDTMALVGDGLTETTAASSGAYRKSQMVTSVVIGDIAVSFEYPEQFTANNVDVDLAASCYRTFMERDCLVNPIKPLQFTFRERLQDWNIQCGMRPRGRLDMFYRYPRGKRSFRSVNEVVDFMLYEIYCLDTTYKQDVPREQENNEGTEAEERPKKRKRYSIYRGRRKRKHRRRTKGKAEEKAEEEKAATEEADEDANSKNEQHTSPSSPPESQKEASPDIDLLNISDDLSAYESLFDKYFDEFQSPS